MDEAQSSELRDLLLHKLPPGRAEQLQDKLLSDAQFASLVETEENDLIDDYVRRSLLSEDAALVEKYILTTPEAKQRAAFAQALSQAAKAKSVPATGFFRRLMPQIQRPAFGMGLAACLILLAFGYLYIRRQSAPPPTGSRTLSPVSPPQVANSGTSNPVPNAESSFAIVLLQSSTRGSEVPTSNVPNGITQLRIQCEIPQSSTALKYELMMMDAAGNRIADYQGLDPHKTSGILYVEAQVSTPHKDGIYVVSVSTDQNPSRHIARYPFNLRFSDR